MTSVSAVIISYNTRAMTLECLGKLLPQLRAVGGDVVVVDNASTDGSAAAIAEAFPEVQVISNERNRGFGAANNQGFAATKGQNLLLLNTDAFVHEGAVTALLSALKNNPRAGVVGPRLLNPDGTVQRSAYPYPSPGQAWLENLWLSRIASWLRLHEDYRYWSHDHVADVPWLIGACLLVRREIVEQVGGFDEDYFMYVEESDWQLRIRGAGWRILFTPDAQVTHLGGASGRAISTEVQQYAFDSLDRYEIKHHGWWGLFMFRAAMVVGSALRIICWMGVYLSSSNHRAKAALKLRLHRWLLVRQSTKWGNVSSAT